MHSIKILAPIAVASCLACRLALAGGDCPADLNGDLQVNGTDLAELLGGWGQPGSTDINGSGTTDGGDLSILLGGWGECPEPEVEVSISAGVASASFTEGGNVGIAFLIEVAGVGSTPVTVNVAQSSSPAGLTIVNDVPPGGFVVSADGTVVFNALVSGATPGSFSLQSVATPSIGGADSVAVPIEVLPAAGIPDLSPLAASPAAVNPTVTTPVTFTLSLVGTSAPPEDFTLARTTPDGTPLAFPATLKDDGVAPDLSAGDGIYSGLVNVTAASGETQRFYRAFEQVGGTAGSGLQSEIYTLTVTNFPVGPAPSNPDAIVQAPDGTFIYSNQFMVTFVDGTTEARIEEIVDSVDGEVIGTIPATLAYQVGIPGNGSASGVLGTIAGMKTIVDVDVVEPIFPNLTAELVPNDPLYPTQVGVRRVRASEAWTISTGQVVIAVVDTGVDATHPDFGGKVLVLPGSDFVDDDDDPSDPDGHGTKMAGVAAAIGNNGIGVAGMAWQSQILAVRALGGSSTDLAAGIIFAAASGARVINVSGGIPEPSVILQIAVSYAIERGCLVVGSAGNLLATGASAPQYPCGFPGVLCVGATSNEDLPLPGTARGEWVAMAAPGQAVPTTVVGGGYGTATGTSPAAAMVSGAAAMVWSMDPTQSASQVRERLLTGALPLPSELGLGAGRLDALEASFDGSFELVPDLSTWSTAGTVSVLNSLGPLVPTDRGRMAYVSTGPAGAGIAASLTKNFIVQPGVTSFGITFSYDFVTEEWPEFVGTQFNDSVRIVLVEPDENVIVLAVESVNGSTFFPVEGIDFPGGDGTVGHTGWKTVSAVIPITKGPGSYVVQIQDAGDDVYDSVVLVDAIRLVGDVQALYCGSPAAGDCCEAHPTPFCIDGSCCNTVCLLDPSCCQTEWDGGCVALAIANCSGCVPPAEICDNGVDDDGDQLVDCDDPDCVEHPACAPPPAEICDNGVDDDGDQLVDCDDPDCVEFPGCGSQGGCGDPQANSCCIVHANPYCDNAECCAAVCAADPFCCASSWDSLCVNRAVAICSVCAPPAEVCDNGVDDDGDQLIDCDDPDCVEHPACAPPPQELCDNGVDDDGDKLVDCADPDCNQDPTCCAGGDPMLDLGDHLLAGGQIDSASFQLSGTAETIEISFDYVSNTSGSWASDMVLVISDGVHPPVAWGGFDTQFNGVVNAGPWPFCCSQSAPSGSYSATVAVPPGALSASGTWTISIGNGWLNSPAVQYDDVIVKVNGACAGGTLAVLDGMENPDLWQTATWQTSNGGQHQVTHQPTGGNPDARRDVAQFVAGGGSLLVVIHQHQSATWDPSVRGPINRVDFGIDYRYLSPIPGGDGQAFGVVAVQGGRFFNGSHAVTGSDPNQWLRRDFIGLNAANFSAWDGGPGPDFSATGGPITFGFYTANSSTGSAFQRTATYDNFSLRVNP